jgi:spore germination cell wall hydrolase CwlJ-like protein
MKMNKKIMIIGPGILALAVFFVLMKWRPGEMIGTGWSFDKRDKDLMVRTIYGEAAHEPRLGQIAVGWVIKNRLQNPYGWHSIAKIVTACGYVRRGKKRVKVCQFEPWVHAHTIKKMRDLKRSSLAYRQLFAVVEDVLSGRASDPTFGSWFFLNEKTVAWRVKNGMKLPAFARNGRCKVVIGRHSFCPRVRSRKTSKKVSS